MGSNRFFELLWMGGCLFVVRRRGFWHWGGGRSGMLAVSKTGSGIMIPGLFLRDLIR